MDGVSDDGNLSNSTNEMDAKPTVLQQFQGENQFKKSLETATATADFSRASCSIDNNATQDRSIVSPMNAKNDSSLGLYQQEEIKARNTESELSQEIVSKQGSNADFMHTPINEEF